MPIGWAMLLCAARTLDVLHEVDAVVLQSAVDTPKHVERPGLVVHGVEGRDEVKALGLGGFVEVAQILRQTRRSGPLPAASAELTPIASERSIPMNRLFGNDSASRFMIRPPPQPTSSTLIPRQPLGQTGYEG